MEGDEEGAGEEGEDDWQLGAGPMGLGGRCNC